MNRASEQLQTEPKTRAKQFFTTIAAESIDVGPTPIDLFTKDKAGRTVLYCRAGLTIDSDRNGILKEYERVFYISVGDEEAYLDYATERIERIVHNPRIRVSDKAKIVHDISTRTVRKLLSDPRSGKAVKRSRRAVDGQVALVLDSREAAAALLALSSFDSYTFSHSVNVCTFCLLLGQRVFGRNKKKLWQLGMSGLMHDIGKSQIDPRIVHKESELTIEEWEEMKNHSIHSEEIIRGHSLPHPIVKAGRNHHERSNGSGYPDGLRGNEIHPSARIVAVSDVYDALTSDRPYRKRLSPVDSLTEMAALEPHLDQDFFDALLHTVLLNDKLVEDFRARHMLPRRGFAYLGR